MPTVTRFSVVVPVLNAASYLDDWFSGYDTQTAKPQKLLFIDSSSNDETADIARSRGAEVVVIPRSDFNHGGTRQYAATLCPDADVIVYLTQDAILADPYALENIVNAFANPDVGVAYGRQLPRKGAGPLEAHARLFNYPAASELRGVEDVKIRGIKAAFCSNSFAAYRRRALDEVGGFPLDEILSEDMVVAARAIELNWKIAYVAEALAYHSHDYTTLDEFRRYFDIGVFHARNKDLLKKFGAPEGEGAKFVSSELKYAKTYGAFLVVSVFVKTFVKYAAFRIGKLERFLPLATKKKIGMYHGFWR